MKVKNINTLLICFESCDKDVFPTWRVYCEFCSRYKLFCEALVFCRAVWCFASETSHLFEIKTCTSQKVFTQSQGFLQIHLIIHVAHTFFLIHTQSQFSGYAIAHTLFSRPVGSSTVNALLYIALGLLDLCSMDCRIID